MATEAQNIFGVQASCDKKRPERTAIKTLGRRKPKKSKHSRTTSRLAVLKMRNPKRITQKSNDARVDLFKLHTSKQYNNTGKHFVLIRCKTRSSVATDNTLLNIPLTARLNLALALATENLGMDAYVRFRANVVW
jgi:hypothetical protein